MSRTRNYNKTKYNQKQRILIVPEGKTEYIYFTTFSKFNKELDKPSIITKQGIGGSAVDTVKHAIKTRTRDRRVNGLRKQDLTYCLLDVEPHSPDTQKLEEARQLADKNNIRIILSNPSFEIWLLSHKGLYKKSFANPQEVDHELKSISGKSKRELESLDMEKLITTPNLKIAIQNSKEVREQHHKNITDTADANSSTEVYKFIEYLLGVTKEPP